MNEQLRLWVDSIKVRWIILGAIIYVGSVFLAAQLIIGPQYGRYYGAVEKQLEIDETYVNLLGLDIEKAVINIDLQLLELDSLRLVFENRLLKSDNVNSIFPIIDRYCTEANLKVVTIEAMNRTETVMQEWEKHLLRLTVLGKFTDYLWLLTLLEQHEEWILIESLNVSPLEEGGGYARMDMVMSVLVAKEKPA
jgi:hypothetical protein